MIVKLLFFQFLFEKKMSKYITVKYYTENKFAKEPYHIKRQNILLDMMCLQQKLKLFYQIS